MKGIIARYWKTYLTMLFGIAVFLFWRFGHPAAMTFQEELQLFLFDDTYLAERLTQPGGIARYIAEFLVQFYNNVSIGALILACLLMALQRLEYLLSKKAFLVSFIPAMLAWYLMGDENIMLTFIVALIVALAATIMAAHIYRTRSKHAILATDLLLTPLLYWIAGPVVLVFTAYLAIWKIQYSASKLSGIAKGASLMLYAIACIVVSALFCPFPLLRLFRGIAYHRFPLIISNCMLMVMALSALIPFVGIFLEKKVGKNKYLPFAFGILLVAAGVWLIPKGYAARNYELMEYDLLVRTNNWDGIVAKAEKKQPDLPMSVCANNLAMAMRGELGDRMFQFYQNGIQGLLPPFERNFTTLFTTSEVYFQLGLVNTSQRFMFEAMEALPDYNKSGRAVKRLAETNLINGQYAVAQKYLNLLKKTLFYRKWAIATEQLLGKEEQIDMHPLYGKLRKLRLQEDFLFSENEIDKIMGQLMMQNADNKMAMQYLLAAPLLERDLNKFMNYMMFVDGKVKYNPISCQEAIAFSYAQKNQQPPNGYVSPMVQQNLQGFISTLQNQGKNSPQLNAYRGTCWYYLMNIGK